MNYRAHDALQDVRVLQTHFGVLQPTAENDLKAPIYSGRHGDKTSGYLQSRSYTTSPPSGSTADRQRPPQRRHRKLSPVNNFHKKN